MAVQYVICTFTGITDDACTDCDENLNCPWLLLWDGNTINPVFNSTCSFTLCGVSGLTWILEEEPAPPGWRFTDSGGNVTFHSEDFDPDTGVGVFDFVSQTTNDCNWNSLSFTTAEGTGQEPCGCGGEPHFVGFDGERFDFHGVPGKCYQIYQDDAITVNAEFKLYNHPDWPPESTIMSKACILLGKRAIILDMDDWRPDPRNRVVPENARNYCLPVGIRDIGGVITDVAEYACSGRKIIVSRMVEEASKLSHLNVSFGFSAKPERATGIIGQTMFTEDLRLPNRYFEVSNLTSPRRAMSDEDIFYNYDKNKGATCMLV